MNVYTIHDSVAQFHLPPFTAPNDGMAERMFMGSLGDSFAYRDGFSLYRIGTFDDASGKITACDPVLCIQGRSIPATADPRPRPLSQPEN